MYLNKNSENDEPLCFDTPSSMIQLKAHRIHYVLHSILNALLQRKASPFHVDHSFFPVAQNKKAKRNNFFFAYSDKTEIDC